MLQPISAVGYKCRPALWYRLSSVLQLAVQTASKVLERLKVVSKLMQSPNRAESQPENNLVHMNKRMPKQCLGSSEHGIFDMHPGGRVSEMLEVMSKSERLQRCGSLKRSHSSPRQPLSPQQGIQFDKVTVVAPSGKVLARDLTFQVCLHALCHCSCIRTQFYSFLNSACI